MTLGWILLACLIVLCALGVVLARSPISSAISLLVGFMGLAILYLVKGAEFVAAVQVLVYAGGIMVLYLFGIMIVDNDLLRLSRQSHSQAWLVFLIMLVIFIWAGHKLYHADYKGPSAPPVVTAEASASETGSTEPAQTPNNTRDVAKIMYGTYLYPFETASVLLLVAVVGGVFLAKKEI